jgi:hypothetical protein
MAVLPGVEQKLQMREELGHVFPNVSSPSIVLSSLCRGKKEKRRPLIL